MPDEMPTVDLIKEMSKQDKFMSYPALTARFEGSLVNFQVACGYKDDNFELKTNDEIVAMWHKSMPGKMPITSLIKTLSQQGKFISYRTIKARFGDSIADFQEACGYVKTNDELTSLWHQIMPNRKPTAKLIDKLSKENYFPSSGTIISRFGGTITNFQEACGYYKKAKNE